jgi:signal transduction histidine kinase
MRERADELGRLARDFDSMAARLQKSSAQQIELTRNISHELRSPLSRMRVALELERKKGGTSTDLERMDQEIERLDTLIGQILAYSRLDSGDSLAAMDYDLAELVEEVAENVRYEGKVGGSGGVSVIVARRNSVRVYGYRDAMNSAIENIVRNAVRHSTPGGTVSVRIDRNADDNLVIEIRDDGEGVEEADLPKLFDAFYRTRRSKQKSGEQGTGLGLAIAARAVARNHGNIAARNGEKGGLVITITVPENGAAT